MPDESKVYSLNYDAFTFVYGEGDTNVAEDISLDLPEGHIVLITGPSGAGKTTVCRAANGLVPHEFKGKMRGQVTIAGRYNSRKYGVSALSKIVGVLQQDPDTQLFNPTVEEEIVFGACNYGLPVDVIRKRTEELLELTRLTAHRRKNPHNLSGGQQQSCALAAILSLDPATLVLDEPTSNIDPIGSQEHHPAQHPDSARDDQEQAPVHPADPIRCVREEPPEQEHPSDRQDDDPHYEQVVRARFLALVRIVIVPQSPSRLPVHPTLPSPSQG